MLSIVVMLIRWHKEELIVKNVFHGFFEDFLVYVNIAIVMGFAAMATSYIGKNFDAE